MTGIPFNIEMCPDSNVNERRMAQDLITNLDPYNGVCEKYENGKRRMYVILSPEEVCIIKRGWHSGAIMTFAKKSTFLNTSF